MHGQRQSVPRTAGSTGEGIKLRVGERDKRNVKERNVFSLEECSKMQSLVER